MGPVCRDACRGDEPQGDLRGRLVRLGGHVGDGVEHVPGVGRVERVKVALDPPGVLRPLHARARGGSLPRQVLLAGQPAALFGSAS